MKTTTVDSRYVVRRFSEVLERILRGEVVIVTRNRRPKAAIVPLAFLQQLQPEQPSAAAPTV